MIGAWVEKANCVGHDPELWFPMEPEPAHIAVSICNVCLVRNNCFKYAQESNQRDGIWGGKPFGKGAIDLLIGRRKN